MILVTFEQSREGATFFLAASVPGVPRAGDVVDLVDATNSMRGTVSHVTWRLRGEVVVTLMTIPDTRKPA